MRTPCADRGVAIGWLKATRDVVVVPSIVLLTAMPACGVTFFQRDFSDNRPGPNMAMGAPYGSPTAKCAGSFTITSGPGNRIYLGTMRPDYVSISFDFWATVTIPNTGDPWSSPSDNPLDSVDNVAWQARVTVSSTCVGYSPPGLVDGNVGGIRATRARNGPPRARQTRRWFVSRGLRRRRWTASGCSTDQPHWNGSRPLC